MKKTIKLAVVAALALGATSAFATNGDAMIGQGAKSRSMGGVGIAKSFGAESGLANPAMIACVEKSEATLVVTAFAPSVSFKTNAMTKAFVQADPTYGDSAANFSVIPEIAYATRINDNTVIGLSVSGTAGMGTDYDDKTGTSDNGAFRMNTALSLLKVAVPVSYEVGGFTAGAAAIMQYGSLQLSHMYNADVDGNASNNNFQHLDNGAESDVGYGVEFGASYDMKALGAKGLTIAAVYKSKIGMTYDNTISSSLSVFGADPEKRALRLATDGITSGDNLDQPAEYGVGISYVMGASTIAADYKSIGWSDATGYADFGWEDQDVYALGYEYATKSYSVRLGYNYAKNPVAEQDGNTYMGAVKNFFNLSGFPGIVETHYTIGGGYNVSEVLSIDGSFIYVPDTEVSYNSTAFTQATVFGMTGAGNTATSTVNVKHSQMALTLAMGYKF